MKTLSTIVLILILHLSSWAQFNISGTITDSSQQPVPFANIIVYPTSPKGAPKGVVTNDEGQYQFESLAQGNYLLEVSVLGFTSEKTAVFTLNEHKTFSFQLKESSETLGEVEIKAKRPVIQQRAEKLVIDLEKSEMQNTNLQDVMRKVPGVLVTNNGINFAGRNDVRILINNKTTEYMDLNSLLRDLPADNIAKVELIEQPGAEFDAEGSGPIINIILKKNIQLGTHGSINSWIGRDQGLEYGSSASLASYKNKLNWQLSLGYSSPTWREDLFIKRQVQSAVYDQATREPYNPKSLRFGTHLDYYLNDEHTLGLDFGRTGTDSERISSSITHISENGTTQTLRSENSFDRDLKVFNINPYYEFNNEHHKLVFDYNHVNYRTDNLNAIYQKGGTVPVTARQYQQAGAYTINTFRMDYKRTFNDTFQLSVGSKVALVATDNDLKAYTGAAGGFQFQADQSNQFLIDENISALYSKLRIATEQWTFSGGLRYEHSNTKGTATNPNSVQSRVISKLFPSASLTKKMGTSLASTLSYSYRIRRPSYNTLNAFVTYYDPLSSEVGNANLRPTFTHNYQFNLSFKGQPFFTVGYSQSKDAMFRLISQNDSTAEISRCTINLDQRNHWNFRLFAPLSFIKKLEGYTGVIVNYNKFTSDKYTLNLSKWNLIWFTHASYNLPWNIQAELNGNYGTGALDGGADINWFADLNFSFGKKFMNDKLKVNLGFYKMLNRGYVGGISYNNINAALESNQSRQNIQLSIRYSFGSKFGKKKAARTGSEEEENRIDNNN